MKIHELVKSIETRLEIPKFETYTRTEEVLSVLASIKENKTKMEAIRKVLPIIEKFTISVSSDFNNFEVEAYLSFIDFKFNHDFVTKSLPVSVRSPEADIKLLQKEMWNTMNNQERVKHALDIHLEYLNDLEKKYKEWLKFLESDVQEYVQE